MAGESIAPRCAPDTSLAQFLQELLPPNVEKTCNMPRREYVDERVRAFNAAGMTSLKHLLLFYTTPAPGGGDTGTAEFLQDSIGVSQMRYRKLIVLYLKAEGFLKLRECFL